MLTADRLRELLDYDPATGIFTWRVARNSRIKAGSVAGGFQYGYARIRVDDMLYRSHRLAWLHVYGTWPSGEVDHRDGVKHNNAIDNLRIATDSQNRANIGVQANNHSGIKGVGRRKSGKWRAQIMVNKKAYHVGLFDTAEEASAAYAKAAQSHFGSFARSA